jgi:hypothetical protein
VAGIGEHGAGFFRNSGSQVVAKADVRAYSECQCPALIPAMVVEQIWIAETAGVTASPQDNGANELSAANVIPPYVHVTRRAPDVNFRRRAGESQ